LSWASAASSPASARFGAWCATPGSASKKTLFAAEQDRPNVARKRRFWKKYQGKLAPERLVFLDETWAKTNMTRTRGWSPRGEALLAKVPHGHWKTLTFLAEDIREHRPDLLLGSARRSSLRGPDLC
jgi:hypothetical protein